MQTNAEKNDILGTMGVRTSTVALTRCGQFHAKPKKPRTLFVTLPNEYYEARLTLAKNHDHREMLTQQIVFILTALPKECVLIDNLILKKKRELLHQRVPAEKQKIRKLVLFNKGPKLETKTEGPSPTDWVLSTFSN